MGVVFVFGILMDVYDVGLFGEYVFVYMLLLYGVIMIYCCVLWMLIGV